ncbi:MAG: hypothetical protein HOV80_18390 [Polyangiaceae bacterium]|nr:hypothetical protein [Polyangiaceae bacterium]
MSRHVVLAALLVAACADPSPGGAGSASAARPRSSGPRIDTTPAPITSAAPSQPPIRPSPGPGPVVDGTALEVRAFVSRITNSDPLHLAIQLVPGEPIEDEMLASLVYEIAPLVGDTKTIRGRKRADKTERGAAKTLVDVTLAEKVEKDDTVTIPMQGAFAKPGKHTLTVRATVKSDKRTLKLASAPLEIQVVEPSTDVRPIEELTQVAADMVKNRRGFEERPSPTAPVVEDREGNVSFRFQVRPPQAAEGDVEVVEVLLDRSGKLVFYDPFRPGGIRDQTWEGWFFRRSAKGILASSP